MSKTYALLHDQVLAQKGYVENLAQTMGQHAVGMVETIRGCALKEPMQMMNGWAEVERANHEWTAIVANGERPESQFRQVAAGVVSSFSQDLRQHAMTLNSDYDLEPTLDRSSTFCSKLSNRSLENMRRHWEDYAGNISRLSRLARSRGPNSESFFTCAADCVRSGQLLGRWLDCTIFE